MPDTTRAADRRPPGSSRNRSAIPVSMAPTSFDTSPSVRFHSAPRSAHRHDPHLTHSRRTFSATLTTRLLTDAACGGSQSLPARRLRRAHFHLSHSRHQPTDQTYPASDCRSGQTKAVAGVSISASAHRRRFSTAARQFVAFDCAHPVGPQDEPPSQRLAPLIRDIAGSPDADRLALPRQIARRCVVNRLLRARRHARDIGNSGKAIGCIICFLLNIVVRGSGVTACVRTTTTGGEHA
ncbi:hypothetical protein EV192_104378 [Actinocrispum wychmicini]|uniref:Uncharacterized protein n=1 Tax=Actinocrispum wychmicini TaxID=1213861 RepID=A0A4R2JQR2_9PSEU|nr:hypothetical protein EV192_104378 [Actinocrispum wychmicini]